MVNKLSIEEQVAALTPEHRNMIPRISRTSEIVGLVVGIPGLLLGLLGLIIMITDPLIATDTYMFGWYAVLGLTLVWIVAVKLFVKWKYPYYSDAKAKYIINQQKKEKRV